MVVLVVVAGAVAGFMIGVVVGLGISKHTRIQDVKFKSSEGGETVDLLIKHENLEMRWHTVELESEDACN